MKFVMIHGSFGSPQDAWFPWLKIELEMLGHEVIAPQFPVDEWFKISQLSVEAYNSKQNLISWFKTFETLLPSIKQHKEFNFVGHSMGTLFTLHIVARYALTIQRAFFVAPFLYPASNEELKNKEIALIHKANMTFYKNNFNFKLLRMHVPHSTVFYSDDDPYIPEPEALEFAEKLGSKVIKLSGLGHMGSESNMKEFPQLLDVILHDNP